MRAAHKVDIFGVFLNANVLVLKELGTSLWIAKLPTIAICRLVLSYLKSTDLSLVDCSSSLTRG